MKSNSIPLSNSRNVVEYYSNHNLKAYQTCYFKYHALIIIPSNFSSLEFVLNSNCSLPKRISNPLKSIARIFLPSEETDDFVAVVVTDVVVDHFTGRTNKVMAPSFLSLNGCLGFGVWIRRPPRYSYNRRAFLLLVVQKEETSSQPPA